MSRAAIYRNFGVSEADDILLDLRHWSLVRQTPSGTITLLADIDFTLRRGEWVGLLGPNGSGKTSLLRYLAAEESPLSAPVGLVFQDPDEQLVAATVSEELALGRPELPVAEYLHEYGLSGLEQLDPRLLSAGEKQRLMLAVALAGRPEVLLCDEPTALQDRQQARWLVKHLQRWHRSTRGALVFATQRRQEAELCDRLLVLEGGHIACQGTPAEILERPDVARIVGWPAEGQTPYAAAGPLPGAARSRARVTTAKALPETSACGAPVAEWREVACRFPDTGRGFSHVNLIIRPGGRLGITGANGCGKSSLLALAAGLRPPTAGCCYLAGRPLCDRRGQDLDHGIALLAPQFPEYFFTRGAVTAEIKLDPALAARGVEQLLAAAGLPGQCAARNPHALSSGERRRLALALVIGSGRPLLLLDEPTAGLDWAGRSHFLSLLAAVPAETAVVVASHDQAFLLACGCELLELTPAGLQQGNPG